jgi:hypothetical protein
MSSREGKPRRIRFFLRDFTDFSVTFAPDCAMIKKNGTVLWKDTTGSAGEENAKIILSEGRI